MLFWELGRCLVKAPTHFLLDFLYPSKWSDRGKSGATDRVDAAIKKNRTTPSDVLPQGRISRPLGLPTSPSDNGSRSRKVVIPVYVHVQSQGYPCLLRHLSWEGDEHKDHQCGDDWNRFTGAHSSALSSIPSPCHLIASPT